MALTQKVLEVNKKCFEHTHWAIKIPLNFICHMIEFHNCHYTNLTPLLIYIIGEIVVLLMWLLKEKGRFCHVSSWFSTWPDTYT